MTSTTRGFNPYASSLGISALAEASQSKIPSAEVYQDLISKLPAEQRPELAKVSALFKKLDDQLRQVKKTGSQTDSDIRTMREIELEKAAILMYNAVKKKEVSSSLFDSIRFQLYHAYLGSDEFLKALELYPSFQSQIGGRLHGLFSLAKPIRETVFLSTSPIEDFFKFIPGSRDSVLKLLNNPLVTLSSAEKDKIFRFGNELPLYFLLVSRLDFNHGICTDYLSGTMETRVRLILGDSIRSIKPDLFKRLCNFASVSA